MTGYILAQMCEGDNLMLTCQNASCGNRGRADAAMIEYRLADNLLQL